MIKKIKHAIMLIVNSTYKLVTRLLILILALTIILTSLYLPRVLAQIQEKKEIDITPTELPDKTDMTIKNQDNDVAADNTTESAEAVQPVVPYDATTNEIEEENVAAIDNNIESADNEEYSEENVNENGRDMSNDPEYIKELEKIYSKEDLQRLRSPRKWVTMPNVVGMTEADALSTMRSLGLVARIIYEDETSEQEGICFMQEFDAGDVWNTDASFFIWIQRNEPEKSENIEELRENESSDLEDIEPTELEENEPEGFPEADEITETPEVEEDTDNIEIAIPTTEPTEENSTDLQ